MIHILPNILRSKGNQTMKFGQLIKYSIRNIYKIKIRHIQGSKIKIKFFSLFVVEDYQNVLKLRCRSLVFTSQSFFKKQKSLESVALSNFLHDF